MDLEKRVDKLEVEINDLKANVGLNNYKTEQILNIVQKLERNIEEIKDKPSKRWEVVVSAFLSGVVGIVIGLVFKK